MTQHAALLQQGLAALRSGDARGARSIFEQVIAAGQADASTHLALAFACGQQGDNDATLAAVDAALAQEPRNLRALLFKGDHLDRMGQKRTAMGFYQAAMQVAAAAGELPPDIQQGLGRAQQLCDQYAGEFEAFLRDSLKQQGYAAGSAPRLEESLDIAVGRKAVHLQQPTRFYYPGLPQQAFYSREQFPFLTGIEGATDAIREELLALMEDEGCFSPYLEHDPDTPQLNDASNVGKMDWSAFYLWKDGAVVEENATRCPQTMAALAAADAPQVPGQTPSALFSRLAPGATIAPHHGMLNTRLICHLPLIVPPNCGALRVGNYQREWREGEVLVFDDSVEHEAWNRSDRPRVVLLFDIWRPELDEEERRWISALLQTVQSYPGG